MILFKKITISYICTGVFDITFFKSICLMSKRGMSLQGSKTVCSGRVCMNTNEEKKVDLESFAQMAGFPVELIRKELFLNEEANTTQVSLDELRKAMIAYLDSTMLEQEINQ